MQKLNPRDVMTLAMLLKGKNIDTKVYKSFEMMRTLRLIQKFIKKYKGKHMIVMGY